MPPGLQPLQWHLQPLLLMAVLMGGGLTACLPTVRPLRLAAVQQVALAGFTLHIDKDPQVGGFEFYQPDTLVPLTDAQNAYDQLSTLLTEARTWKVIPQRAMMTNPTYQSIVAEQQEQRPITHRGAASETYVGKYQLDGMLSASGGRAIPLTMRRRLLKDLSVDALVAAKMRVRATSDAVMPGTHGQMVYQGTITLQMMDARAIDPIWEEPTAQGAESDGTRNLPLGGVEVTGRSHRAFWEAVVLAYDELMQRYEKELKRADEGS